MIDRAAERPNLGDTIVSLFRYRELLKNLVMKDLKLKVPRVGPRLPAGRS